MERIYINHILTKRKRVQLFRGMTTIQQYRFNSRIFKWFRNRVKQQRNLISSSSGHQKMQAIKVKIFQLILINSNTEILLQIHYLKNCFQLKKV